MSGDDIIKVETAHKQGKQIQWRPKDWPEDHWSDVPKDALKIKWEVLYVEWRVKPND